MVVDSRRDKISAGVELIECDRSRSLLKPPVLTVPLDSELLSEHKRAGNFLCSLAGGGFARCPVPKVPQSLAQFVGENNYL